MRLAHLSDLHLIPDGALEPCRLLNRRVFGAANLLANRGSLHGTDAARRAVAGVLGAGVDHVVVTGDLVNLALESEFALAADVLAPLGQDPGRLSVIPGNHDYYTSDAVRTRRFERWFGRFVWGVGTESATYPAFKDLGNVRLILAGSAMLPPPLCAFGRLGRDQMDQVFALARQGADAGRFVVLAVHHNLHPQKPLRDRTGRLLDRDELRARLAESPVGLVIHGHDHHEHEMRIGSRAPGGTLVVGCGSSSVHAPGRGRYGRFNIYDIPEDGSGTLGVERWESGPDGGFVRRGR